MGHHSTITCAAFSLPASIHIQEVMVLYRSIWLDARSRGVGYPRLWQVWKAAQFEATGSLKPLSPRSTRDESLDWPDTRLGEVPAAPQTQARDTRNKIPASCTSSNTRAHPDDRSATGRPSGPVRLLAPRRGTRPSCSSSRDCPRGRQTRTWAPHFSPSARIHSTVPSRCLSRSL